MLIGEEFAPADVAGICHWRMHLAAERILRSRTNLTELAFDLGYASDTAFRAAFGAVTA